eukprot:scaffold22496_cov27-Tisochrysis_lutea.AAC.4
MWSRKPAKVLRRSTCCSLALAASLFSPLATATAIVARRAQIADCMASRRPRSEERGGCRDLAVLLVCRGVATLLPPDATIRKLVGSWSARHSAPPLLPPAATPPP